MFIQCRFRNKGRIDPYIDFPGAVYAYTHLLNTMIYYLFALANETANSVKHRRSRFTPLKIVLTKLDRIIDGTTVNIANNI